MADIERLGDFLPKPPEEKSRRLLIVSLPIGAFLVILAACGNNEWEPVPISSVNCTAEQLREFPRPDRVNGHLSDGLEVLIEGDILTPELKEIFDQYNMCFFPTERANEEDISYLVVVTGNLEEARADLESQIGEGPLIEVLDEGTSTPNE